MMPSKAPPDKPLRKENSAKNKNEKPPLKLSLNQLKTPQTRPSEISQYSWPTSKKK
jgi:hypothetical protein